ncbi:unnamed protein product [Ostreobium quekettii]|uniref:Ubiquitin-like domain-containing protein n=1 Tax=Ostreobium quekettii TaxID=121088 RepID=A0A8S1J6R4_9CHLO|nr:unnamed protein product [Ostreobium quekettii]|eukprot:evm.model.scf_213EXC.5 EVM.evm.TU.scf_213EXC.5   scf_213EXC:65887-69610(-)
MQIFATRPDGGVVSLDVDRGTTVGALRSMMEEEGCPAGDHSLTFRGLALDDDHTLGFYGIDHLCNFQSSVRLRGGMMIKVKTLTGKEIEIDIDPTDTIQRIKERLEEKEGIPPVQQRLIFGGRQLSDDKNAKDYNIEGGSVLHLVS